MNIEVRVNSQSKNEELVLDTDLMLNITKLNLDVTAMMAYVSSLTCESCDFEFKHTVLNEQAARESLISTKKFLDNLFKGKSILEIYSHESFFHYYIGKIHFL